MAGSGDHIKALLKSHAAGDDSSFYAVMAQIAAHEARRGHNRLAAELKKAIEGAKVEPVAPLSRITKIPHLRSRNFPTPCDTLPQLVERLAVRPHSVALAVDVDHRRPVQ